MSFDIAIVGAGIAGASLAWQSDDAPRPRPRSLLLEAEDRSPGCTAPVAAPPCTWPATGSPQARALTRAGRRFYQQPARRFQPDVPLVAPRGVLYAAWDDHASSRWTQLAGRR
jgi:D-arginine dehydrogenase